VTFAPNPTRAPEDEGVERGVLAKHLKTGNVYGVLYIAIDATNARDGNRVVVYGHPHGVFVRDLEEFKAKFVFEPESDK